MKTWFRVAGHGGLGFRSAGEAGWGFWLLRAWMCMGRGQDDHCGISPTYPRSEWRYTTWEMPSTFSWCGLWILSVGPGHPTLSHPCASVARLLVEMTSMLSLAPTPHTHPGALITQNCQVVGRHLHSSTQSQPVPTPEPFHRHWHCSRTRGSLLPPDLGPPRIFL